MKAKRATENVKQNNERTHYGPDRGGNVACLIRSLPSILLLTIAIAAANVFLVVLNWCFCVAYFPGDPFLVDFHPSKEMKKQAARTNKQLNRRGKMENSTKTAHSVYFSGIFFASLFALFVTLQWFHSVIFWHHHFTMSSPMLTPFPLCTFVAFNFLLVKQNSVNWHCARERKIGSTTTITKDAVCT